MTWSFNLGINLLLFESHCVIKNGPKRKMWYHKTCFTRDKITGFWVFQNFLWFEPPPPFHHSLRKQHISLWMTLCTLPHPQSTWAFYNRLVSMDGLGQLYQANSKNCISLFKKKSFIYINVIRALFISKTGCDITHVNLSMESTLVFIC